MTFDPVKRYTVVQLGSAKRLGGTKEPSGGMAAIRVSSNGFDSSGAYNVTFYPRKNKPDDAMPDFAAVLLAPPDASLTAEALLGLSCPSQEFNGAIEETMTLTIPPDVTQTDVEYAAYLVVGFPA